MRAPLERETFLADCCLRKEGRAKLFKVCTDVLLGGVLDVSALTAGLKSLTMDCFNCRGAGFCTCLEADPTRLSICCLEFERDRLIS